MPVISTFFGIYVRMYFADHGPPHCPSERSAWWRNGVWITRRNWRRIGKGPKRCSRWSGFPEQTMIKLIAAECINHHEIRLRFSDDSFGVYDFAEILNAGTAMTEPLRDPVFFRSVYLELGALAWPNGFDLSAASLQERLKQAGALRRSSEAA